MLVELLELLVGVRELELRHYEVVAILAHPPAIACGRLDDYNDVGTYVS